MGTISKTAAQLDTVLMDMDGTTETNFRIKAGVFQVKNTDDSKWHTIWIDGSSLMISQTGEA